MTNSAASQSQRKSASARRGAAVVFSISTLALLLAGCGAPGDPVARHPVTPLRVTDLAAHQQGDAVVLNFTLPRDSTDQKPLNATPTVEIYRTDPPPAGAPARARTASPRLADTVPAAIVQTDARDGHFEFSDSFDPAAVAAAPGAKYTYTVRTRVSTRAASADSNPVTVALYPTAAAITDLRATLTEQAVALAWTPTATSSSGAALASPAFRVYRTEVPSLTSAAPGASAAPRAPLQLIGPTTDAAYRDTTFELGHSYIYTVRTLAPTGNDTVESADSNLVTVETKDIFPPAVPQDIVAVFVPATPDTAANVDVTWAINVEPDLAGYIVYRSEQANSQGERLNPTSLAIPAFRDTSVAPGRTYYYRIASVDRAGNESAPSEAVTLEIP